MYVSGGGPMRKSFKDSLKVLEADVQHANTLWVILIFQIFFFRQFFGFSLFVFLSLYILFFAFR